MLRVKINQVRIFLSILPVISFLYGVVKQYSLVVVSRRIEVSYVRRAVLDNCLGLGFTKKEISYETASYCYRVRTVFCAS